MLSKVLPAVAAGVLISSLGLSAYAATPTMTDIDHSYAKLDNAKYKAASDQLQQVYDLLTSSKKAMGDLASYRMKTDQTVASQGGTRNDDTTTDFTRSPYESHVYGTDRFIDAQGNTQSLPVDMYDEPNITYWLHQGDNRWNYTKTGAYDLEYNNLYLIDPKALTPYLTLTDQGDTYQLSGTLNGAELGTAFPDTDGNVVKFLQSEQITIAIDKSTDRVISTTVSNQIDFPPLQGVSTTPTDQQATTVSSFDNYNNEQPIQVPAAVVSSAVSG